MRIASLVPLLALAAAPALAAHHRQPHRPARAHTHARHTPEHRAARTPAGVTTVPAGGLKVYCAGSRSPLLVRKFTQGSGTTVTVLCR